MAQHEYSIPNQTGAQFRADLNDALEAIVTQNSGSSAPNPTFAYQYYINTSNGLLRQRDGTNSTWTSIRKLDTGNTFHLYRESQGTIQTWEADLGTNTRSCSLLSPESDSQTEPFIFSTANSWRFRVDTTEAMTIDSVGYVGIGLTNPSDYNADARNLVVYESSANAGITVATSSSSFKTSVYFADGTTSGADSVGRVEYDHSDNSLSLFTNGIARQHIGQNGSTFVMANNNSLFARSTASAGTTYTFFEGLHNATAGSTSGGTVAFKVYTNGSVQNTYNSYGALSDINRKENITDANSQWSDLKSIQVKNFNFIGDSASQIGVIAQQVETVSPGLVYDSTETDENDVPTGVTTKAVKYSVLYMKAVKALQEAMERIEALEARVTALESP